MYTSGPLQLQPGSVQNMTAEVARSKTGVAKWFLWIGGFFVFAVVAMALDSGGRFNPNKMSPTDMIGGGLVWVALLWGIAAVFLRKASRARKIGEAARSNPTLIWYLNGNLIVASDHQNVSHPDLSFKINDRLRTMLTTAAETRARPFDR